MHLFLAAALSMIKSIDANSGSSYFNNDGSVLNVTTLLRFLSSLCLLPNIDSVYRPFPSRNNIV